MIGGKFAVIIWVQLFILTLVGVAIADAQSPSAIFKDDETVPWHIRADLISYDSNTGIYRGDGNVTISKNNKTLSADQAEFNANTMEAAAEGHVVLSSGSDVMTGARIQINLKTETGTLYDGSIFLSENHFYFRGDTIQKTDRQTFTADRVSFTTCDGESPAWKITGKNLNVAIEGYGTVRHAAFHVGNTPVFYFPFLIFPVKLNRQSGLLIPQIGHSDRKGFEYVQPVFWAISDASDATFYWNYIQKRGNKFGMEYRYLPNPSSKGTAMVDFLHDRQTDDGSIASGEDWGYSDDALARKNADRYWFRMKHDQTLPFHVTAQLDADMVSDQDYLTEFRNGLSGFEKSKAWFHEFFGREFDDYNDPVRTNRLFLGRIWDAAAVSGELRYYQNSSDRNSETEDDTLHQLPRMQFYISKMRLSDSVFYAGLDSEYTYFYRERGIRGHLFDIAPRIHAPFRFKNIFTFEPSVGFRETVWMADVPDDQTVDASAHRELFDVHAELFSELYRTFGVSENGNRRFRHSVRPLIEYDYIPNKNQDDIPYFDSTDRTDAQNRITFSVVQFLSGKKSPDSVFRQWCRLKIEQQYFPEEPDKPFSPLSGEIDLTPLNFFTFHADAYWDHDAGQFLSRNLGVSVFDRRGDALFAEYRCNPDQSESVRMNVSAAITPALSSFLEYERNLFENKDVRKGIRFTYAKQCWAFSVSYFEEENDRRVDFMIDLYGLGGFEG